ncbi:YraN family protein [Rickettsiales bacterium]|nr:YraN family protein [Rickettsiales bacterium]
MKNSSSYDKGLYAEILSILLLFFKGYRILKWRYKTKVGEIDIIAKKSNSLVFIEVKARKKLSDALESITPRQKDRIIRASSYFIKQKNYKKEPNIRFDVMILCDANFLPKHIKHAW